MIQSVNPVSGEIIATYEKHSFNEVDTIIHQCAKAHKGWAKEGFDRRSALMLKASEILRTQANRFARMITLEMGKPIKQSRAEVLKCAKVCDYYAENASTFLANEKVKTAASESYIAFRPLGVVLAIMPWNFPFWQVFRFAAPALMAGNGALLKHASNVTGSALMIEQIFKEAGFPEHLFRTIKLAGKETASVISHDLVKAVTLTGSVGAGKAVAGKAGSGIKKSVLELGGSDPYIILEDADLEKAVDVCVNSRVINSGQSCIAAKRFIVVKEVQQRFEQLFVEKMKEKVMGDPMSDETEIGPQATPSLRDELHAQVTSSIEMGATCLLGGEIPKQTGAWYPPTVLSHVKKGMPAYDEELFGPVAAIIEATDETDAIRIANDSVFGLGAAIFTKNIERGQQIAEKEIQAGCCFVNEMVQSDPRLPFGGIGASGYGRELSYAGIREFTNIKTVYVK